MVISSLTQLALYIGCDAARFMRAGRAVCWGSTQYNPQGAAGEVMKFEESQQGFGGNGLSVKQRNLLQTGSNTMQQSMCYGHILCVLTWDRPMFLASR